MNGAERFLKEYEDLFNKEDLGSKQFLTDGAAGENIERDQEANSAFIKSMEENGTFNTWNDLKKFTSNFIEKNHPLTNEDYEAMINGKITYNVARRKVAFSAMQDEMYKIISEEAESNKEMQDSYQNALNNKNWSSAIDILNQSSSSLVKSREKEYEQRLLEARWEKLAEFDRKYSPEDFEYKEEEPALEEEETEINEPEELEQEEISEDEYLSSDDETFLDEVDSIDKETEEEQSDDEIFEVSEDDIEVENNDDYHEDYSEEQTEYSDDELLDQVIETSEDLEVSMPEISSAVEQINQAQQSFAMQQGAELTNVMGGLNG